MNGLTGGLLVSGHQQDETVFTLLEISDGLTGFGLHRDVLGLASHVNLQT